MARDAMESGPMAGKFTVGVPNSEHQRSARDLRDRAGVFVHREPVMLLTHPQATRTVRFAAERSSGSPGGG